MPLPLLSGSNAFIFFVVQGWIQTSATSFQKLVRIVKTLKKNMPESLDRHMPILRRCLITEFFNSNCTAFVASFQRTSALSFTEPSPHHSPSRSVDLCSICAPVQIFYYFLCTNRNSLSLAEHNCHQSKSLFIGCCDSVY